MVAAMAFVLGGCTPSPADDDVCPPTLITDHTAASVTATTAVVTEPAWPLTELGPVVCTAELTLVLGDGKTVRSQIALVNSPIADVTADLDRLTADPGWTRNDAGRIWTDPADPGHTIRIREIEEGTLVGIR